MKYRFLLFDADNTLLDFTACEAKAFAEALKLCGIPQKPGMTEVYSAYNDRCWKELERGELTKPQLVVKRYALFLEHYGIDKDPQTVNETYADCLSKTAIELPGAEDLLKRLYGKAKIYIITNGLTKVQKGRFARTGMTEYIEEIFISEQMGCKKPCVVFQSGGGKDSRLLPRAGDRHRRFADQRHPGRQQRGTGLYLVQSQGRKKAGRP